MLTWNKLGRIFNPATDINDGIDRPWMREFCQSVSTLIFDDFVRVYFSCRPPRDKDGAYISNTAFVDLNTCNLFHVMSIAKAPVLPLGELGMFDQFAIYPTSVIRHDGKVMLYYAGWSREKPVPFNTAIGLAISKDGGTTFERVGRGPMLSHSFDEPCIVSGPKIRRFNNKWYLYYLAGSKWLIHNGRPECVYKIRMATSDDGINWARLNRNIIEDLLEPDECQAGPDVFYYRSRYHMYFVSRYATDFRENRDRGYRIGYAYSDDLVNWTRDERSAGIQYSDTGWDSQMHHYPHVFELNGKHYMLYNGNEFGRYGFGIAELEPDEAAA